MNKALVGNVLFGFDFEVCQWVANKIPAFTASSGATALGVVSGTELVAGVVYERYNGIHLEISIATESRKWASRSTLFSLFQYPFEQLNCLAISVVVPSSNLQSLNLATKLGFEAEAIIKYAAHDGSSLIILKLLKENCKWIGDSNGQRRRSTRGTRSV